MGPAPPSTDARQKAPPAPKPAAKVPEAGAAAAGKAAASATPAKAPSPAGSRFDRMAVRAKLAVSAPGDPVEREADRAADKVMRAIDQERAPGAAASSAAAPPRRPDAPLVSRQPAPAGHARPTVPADFARNLGTGQPLDPATRSLFERQYGADLSRVRVHDDAAADAAARAISARAFTHGSHIAFATGEYQPGTPEGRRLLAHEIAHVLQHDGEAGTVMRQPTGSGAAAAPVGTGAPELRVGEPLRIPPIKARHSATYSHLAGANALRRARGYNSATRRTGQIPNWLAGVRIDLRQRLPQQYHPANGTGWSLPLQRPLGSAPFRTVAAPNDNELAALLKRPEWNADGGPTAFQVDHAVEYQVNGLDDISNYELLDQAHNGSIGPAFAAEINRAIGAELEHPASLPAPASGSVPPNPTPSFAKDNYDVVFTRVQVRGRESRRTEAGSLFWSREQVEHAEPATMFLPAASGNLDGTAQRVAVLSPTENLAIARFPVNNNQVVVPAAARGGIAGFRIDRVEIGGGVSGLSGPQAGTAPVGALVGALNFGPAVQFPPEATHSLALQKAGHQFAVKIASTPTPGPNGATNLIPATFAPLSPMEISDIVIGQGVYAKAIIIPTHPALSSLRIPGEIRNGRLGIFHVVDATALARRLNLPGLTMDEASITIGYDGTDVFVGGSAGFTIRNFGTGTLAAEIDTARRFALEGSFRADTRLFDEADLRVWYRSEGGFGASGRLAITNPNKIRGIRSASVQARYANGVFHADGTVEPSIPGLQSAGLAVTYGPDPDGGHSLLIEGDLLLAAGIPGISGGSLHVSMLQREERWRVSGRGEVRPNLPGLSPVILLTYDDGLFTGEVTAAFRRSIFDGSVLVGMSNRAVTPEGELSGTEPGDALVLYGHGTVNARLTDWLQGGVGVKVKPTGTVLLSGRIGLADALTVFDQYPPAGRDRRSLFSMPTISIPLLGAPGVGVSLNISGRIEGYAHVGPGRLTQAEVNVIDFDPAIPESLHIAGHASFEVPAVAGVDAAMDAGLAAGAVISLEAGLGVSAGVAAQALARQRVDVDWAEASGLHLHADLSATVTPKLRFGVRGYARIIAGAFGMNIELWRKDWTLAEREAGANLAIGLNVPIDYYSDNRGLVFDSQRVSFTVPQLNADTLNSLLNDNGEARREYSEGQPTR